MTQTSNFNAAARAAGRRMLPGRVGDSFIADAANEFEMNAAGAAGAAGAAPSEPQDAFDRANFTNKFNSDLLASSCARGVASLNV